MYHLHYSPLCHLSYGTLCFIYLRCVPLHMPPLTCTHAPANAHRTEWWTSWTSLCVSAWKSCKRKENKTVCTILVGKPLAVIALHPCTPHCAMILMKGAGFAPTLQVPLETLGPHRWRSYDCECSLGLIANCCPAIYNLARESAWWRSSTDALTLIEIVGFIFKGFCELSAFLIFKSLLFRLSFFMFVCLTFFYLSLSDSLSSYIPPLLIAADVTSSVKSQFPVKNET